MLQLLNTFGDASPSVTVVASARRRRFILRDESNTIATLPTMFHLTTMLPATLQFATLLGFFFFFSF